MKLRLNNPLQSRRQLPGLFILAGISLSVFVFWSLITYRIGFPLDDAWIHQTYARNLAENGQWEFLPGEPSAGSTSPLWSGLLALGYLTPINSYIWSYVLGWLLLFGLSFVGGWVFRLLRPEDVRAAFWVSLFLVFEWHLVWASGSGMETLLFSLIVMVVFGCLVSRSVKWFVVGLMVGLSIWIRPDGLTLLGPAFMIALFSQASWKERLVDLFKIFLGVALLLLPYLWFNYSLGGELWPNTFFAKQAEYAHLQQIPLWRRFLSLSSQFLVGAGALLFPGLVIFISRSIRDRNWSQMAWIIWLLGYVFVFAVRLPVTYQHGRYLIPAMPVYFILGLAGTAALFNFPFSEIMRRVFTRVWWIATATLLVLFWFLGGRAYALDVAVIESEMVVTARWMAENTPEQALIAAHDIGALGYFADRQILDMAGLVSPEVIPFIRDEAQLRDLLNARGADYLVTFPGWYPELVMDLVLVHSSNGKFSPQLGGENMAIYLWSPP